MGGQDDPQVPGPGTTPPMKDIFSQIQDAAVQASIQPFAQKLGASEQRVRQIDGKLGELGAGTDPAYTSSDDHFQGMSHQALYDAVNGVGGLDPKGLQTMRQTWFECASELENLSSFTLSLGMNNIFGHGLWKGVAADAAQAASERYMRVANQIGQVFESVAMRMDGMAWTAEAVRKAVQPPPNSVTLTPNSDNPGQAVLPLLPNPQAMDQAEVEREKARQDAIRALDSIYTPSFPPSGANVPAYLDVPKIAGVGDGNPSAGGWNSGTGAGGSEGLSATGPEPVAAPSAEPPGAGPQDASPAATNPAGVGVPQGLLPTGTGTEPAATTAAGMGPGAGGSSSPGATGSGGPGGGYGGSGPSVASPGGLGASRPGMPAFGMPGGAFAAETGAGAAGRGAAAAAKPGTPMGGIPHGAHGRGDDKDDEREHRTPDYLKGIQPDWEQGLQAPSGIIDADSAPRFDAADDRYIPPQTFAPTVDRTGQPPTNIDPFRVPPVPAASDPVVHQPVPPTTPTPGNAAGAQRAPISHGATDYRGTDTFSAVADTSAEPAAPPAAAANPAPHAVADDAFRWPQHHEHQRQADDDPVSELGPAGEGDTAEDSDPGEYIFISGAGPMMDDDPGEGARQ